MRSGFQNTVDPHSGQKWKVASFPTPELRVKVFDLPLITSTALPSKRRRCLARCQFRWQSTQWRIEARLGSPAQRICGRPQAQMATRCVIENFRRAPLRVRVTVPVGWRQSGAIGKGRANRGVPFEAEMAYKRDTQTPFGTEHAGSTQP